MVASAAERDLTPKDPESKQPIVFRIVGVVGARAIVSSSINGNLAALPKGLMSTLEHLGLVIEDKEENYIL